MTASNRTALVTGASRGIGRAIAIGLAQRGYDVVINDIERQKDALAGVAKEIETLGRRVLTVCADVSSKADVTAMAKAVGDAFGHLDAVVNNAGILIAGDVEGLKEEYWDSVMDVNAKGTFLVIQAVLPMMKARRYGRIVNIASIGGKHGAPEQAHYSASKAAVMGFTRPYWPRKWALTGSPPTACAPGSFSPIWGGSISTIPRSGRIGRTKPPCVASAIPRMLSVRWPSLLRTMRLS